MRKRILLTLLILLPVLLWGQEEAVVFNETVYDFGTIKEEAGTVTKIFEFTNQGEVPVIVNRVGTTCGCTAPVWTKKPVLPKKKGVVKVTFDPRNRPGIFSKYITVVTNAGTKRLQVKGVVTPRPKTLSEQYPKKMGALRLATQYFMFNEISNKSQKEIEVAIANDSNESITIDFDKVPDYISVKMDKKTLSPQEKSSIKLLYDANKTNFWGFKSEMIPVVVNDEKKVANTLIVGATVVEDFSHLTDEERAKAPIMGVDEFNKKMVQKVKGDTITTIFKITNIGQTPLQIYKIETSSKDVTTFIASKTIAPNTQQELKVMFYVGEKRGYQNQQVTLITNAPDLPVVNLRLSGILD